MTDPSAPGPAKRGQRTRGRPSSRAAGAPAVDLRARLLDAAIVRYAIKGIAATSLRDIASEAGVTPALLHYYFGDKTQLVDAVIEERLMTLFADLLALLQQAGDNVAELVAGFVIGVDSLVARHPWLPSLWVREVLSEGGALRDLLVGRMPEVPLLLARRFAAAQREGRLNPDLDPRLLVMSLVGLTLFPAAGAPIWRRIFDADDLDADALRLHTLALLDRGLEVK